MSMSKQHGFLSSRRERLKFKLSQTLHCSHYEHVIQTLNERLQEKERRIHQLELENQQLKAQLAALHRSQFKGRRHPVVPKHPDAPAVQGKKRGAPIGHPACIVTSQSALTKSSQFQHPIPALCAKDRTSPRSPKSTSIFRKILSWNHA